MLRVERKYESHLTKILSSSCQKGSILLGLIITMVVMAVLGAGMVYLTTTSTFQELLANNNMRAYYAAESGGRYANSLVRTALAYGNPSLITLSSSFAGSTGTTYTMANGDSFQINNWIQHGTTSLYFTYDSIGTTGSGFLQAKRKLSYNIYPANQGGLALPPPIPPAASEFEVPQGQQAAAWLGQFYDPTAAQDTKIFVQSAGGDAALNLAATDYTMGLKWSTNLSMAQFDALRAAHNNLLSYGVQVKIWENENVNYSEMIGISFRLDDSPTTTKIDENMYGISFVKMGAKPDTKPNNPAWYADYIWGTTPWDVFSTNPYTWFVVLWKKIDNSGWTYQPLAYQKILQSDSADSVCLAGDSNGCITLKPWTTLMVYVEEISGGNKITAYIASPNTYGRRTITPYNLDTQHIYWAEDEDGNLINPSIFQQISWSVITGSGATGLSGNRIQDGSLTTSNYDNSLIGIISDTKPREIGLHVFTSNEGANKIFYDNFYIDLTPSGYGYIDGSGQVIQYP